MKKYLLYIFMAFAAISFTACEEDAEPMGTTVGTDQASLSFAGQGAAAQSLSVMANGDWIAVTPEWITVTPNYGSGNTTVSVTVADNMDAADGGMAAERSGEITFTLNGNSSVVTILQAGDPNKKPVPIEKKTVAEFNAAPEDPAVFYELTGVIANISNLKYGNFDLVDETGSVYVYGLYESKTVTDNYAFERLGLSEGDKITLHGYRGSYGDKIEVMGAYYVSHEPSLISADLKEVELPIDGGSFDIKLAYKGETFEVAISEEARGWLTMGTILPQEDTTVITFNASRNDLGAREATISFTTTKGSEVTTVTTTVKQEGSIIDLSIADFLAKEDGSSLYRLTGKVKSIVSDTYGNIYLEDATGEVYVYGVTATSILGQSNDKSFKSLGIKVGDILTIVGTRASYKGEAQVGGPAYYESHISHTEATVAEVLAAATGDTYYKVTGTIANVASDSYGNFDLVDETGTIYVYGLTKAPVAKNDKSYKSLGLKEGDKVTLIGKRAEYKGTAQIGSAYYVSHEAAPEGGEGGEGNEGGEGSVIENPAAVIISEYVEGSSSNKYLEIANISEKEVDLAAYTLLLYTNGGTEPNAQNTTVLSGKLAPGAVKVFKGANAALTLPEGVTAEVCAACNFNGDDVVVLTCNGTAVDAFGTVGNAKDNNFAKDKTYRRNAGKTPTMTFNQTADWTEAAKDDVSGLGTR